MAEWLNPASEEEQETAKSTSGVQKYMSLHKTRIFVIVDGVKRRIGYKEIFEAKPENVVGLEGKIISVV